MTRTRYLAGIGVACAMGLGLIACGDDKSDTSSTPTTTAVAAAPEDKIAPDAEVTAGLNALVKVADTIAAISDEAASKKASEGLEPVWKEVEGTVKQNEPDLYATVEEDLSLLESGDQAKTKTGAAEMRKTVDAYLAKHP